MKHRRILRRAVRQVGIPEDIVLGMPRILMRGDRTLLLENHRGVIEYGEERLRVNTALGILVVEGTGLTLSALGEEDLLLTGSIHSVVMGGGKAGRL